MHQFSGPLVASTDMRIFINAVGVSMGGAARHLNPFLSKLRAVRPSWRVDLFITLGAMDHGVAPSGVVVHGIPRSGTVQRLRWDSFEIAQAARRGAADLIVNLANYGPLRPDVPSLLYQRNSLYFDQGWLARRPMRDRIESLLRRGVAYRQMAVSSAVVVPSHAMATFIRSWPGWNPSIPIRVVPHGVDTTRFGFHPRALQSDGPIRILNVSHAAPHKDFETAIGILALVRNAGVDASLLITASREDDPTYVGHLIDTIRRLRLDDHVHLLGRVAGVEALYSDCDILLSTSRTESFGFPLLEGMASGISIVASSIPSSVEILTRTAHLFTPADARQGAEAVLSALAMPEVARRRRLAAARAVAIEHSWVENAESVAAIIDDVVRER